MRWWIILLPAGCEGIRYDFGVHIRAEERGVGNLDNRFIRGVNFIKRVLLCTKALATSIYNFPGLIL